VSDPIEPGEMQRHAHDIEHAADDLSRLSQALIGSGSDLGVRVSRAVQAVREFADDVATAERELSATD
jgi:hypothetical protein